LKKKRVINQFLDDKLKNYFSLTKMGWRKNKFLNLVFTYLEFVVKKSTVKPVLRGHFWEKEKVALYDRWPLKRGSIFTKLSMTGQKKVIS
jgi:hypothetical protein